MCSYQNVHVKKGVDNFWELALSFYNVSPRDQIWVIKVGGKGLYC